MIIKVKFWIEEHEFEPQEVSFYEFEGLFTSIQEIVSFKKENLEVGNKITILQYERVWYDPSIVLDILA